MSSLSTTEKIVFTLRWLPHIPVTIARRKHPSSEAGLLQSEDFIIFTIHHNTIGFSQMFLECFMKISELIGVVAPKCTPSSAPLAPHPDG
jgi:hypothetical protein